MPNASSAGMGAGSGAAMPGGGSLSAGLQGVPLPPMPGGTSGSDMYGPTPQGASGFAPGSQQPQQPQQPSSLANAMQTMQLVHAAASDAQQTQGKDSSGGYSPQGPIGALPALAKMAAMFMAGGG